MSSTSPLVEGIRQAFRAGRLDKTETYRGIPIRSGDPDWRDQLAQQEPPLPNVGGVESRSGLNVLGVSIRPTGNRSDVSDITYTLSSSIDAGGVATTANQSDAEVSFEIFPESAEVEIPSAVLFPVSTETVEVGEDGLPTEPPTMIGSPGADIEEGGRVFNSTRARVIYTVTGTAASLGIPVGFNFGTIPGMLLQTDTIHVIGVTPLLFRIGSVRQVTRTDGDPGASRYSISYEWTADLGVLWATPQAPYAVDPEIGKAGELFPVPDTIGAVEADTDGNVFSGVFLPHIEVPGDLLAIVGPTRFISPPFCTIERGAKQDQGIPYPTFIANPQYKRVAPDDWQNLPGVF